MTRYIDICKETPCADCELNETYINGHHICSMTVDDMRNALYVITEEKSYKNAQEIMKNERH